MAEHHRADLVVHALRMAAGRGGPEEDCIFHTDLGSELNAVPAQGVDRSG